MKQKGDDYKITAVRYYLNNNDTMDNTCKIFNCKKPSLHRWIQIYKTRKNLQRKPRKSISYKVKKEQLKTNYFDYAYKTKESLEYSKKSSTRKCKPKKYKE